MNAATMLFVPMNSSPILFIGFLSHLKTKVLNHFHSLALVEVSLHPLNPPTSTLVDLLE